MIDYNIINELIKNSSNVIITAHKDIDLDALGSILGMYYIVSNAKKNTYILIEDEKSEPEVRRALSKVSRLDKIKPVKYFEIINEINDNTLLIIMDTNSSSRLQNIELLNIKNKILLDHHIEDGESINNLSYKYIDSNQSSSTEIVMKIINELNIYIPTYVATIMLAGIYIDTNGFRIKTNENTHECAANLYKFEANIKELHYLLKQNFARYERRQKLILKAEFYDTIAITTGGKYLYDNAELAKSSDTLLTFNGVELAFSIARINKDNIGISARSLGNVDVQKIMSHFNGGGHRTEAATSIPGNDVEIIKSELLNYLRGE